MIPISGPDTLVIADPTNKSECETRLRKIFSAEIIDAVTVKGKINDYVRSLTDREIYPLPTPWQGVLDAAKAKQREKLQEIGDKNSNDEYTDGDGRGSRVTGSDPDQDKDGIDYILKDWDYERMAALCAYCAKDAAKQKRVIRFRETCLIDGFLTEDQYLRMVNSPGLGLLSAGELQSNNLPLDSSSEVVNCFLDADGSLRWTILFIEPDVTLTITKRITREIYGTGGRGINVSTSPGSVLHLLGALGDTLAQDFQWNKEDAYIFLVTGQAPSSLRTESKKSNLLPSASPWNSGLNPPPIPGVISLQVPCWLSPKQVSSIYHDAVAPPGPDGKKTSLAGRPIGSKSVRLFAFLESQEEKHGMPSQWSVPKKKEIQRVWNDQCLRAGKKEDQILLLKRFMSRCRSVSEECRKALTGWTPKDREVYYQYREASRAREKEADKESLLQFLEQKASKGDEDKGEEELKGRFIAWMPPESFPLS